MALLAKAISAGCHSKAGLTKVNSSDLTSQLRCSAGVAENTPAETFVDNVDRLAFDNWEEHEALYPDGKAIVEMPYPRAKSHRQVPTAMKRRLEARAAELYEALPAVA